MFNLEYEIQNWLIELRRNPGFEDGDIAEMEDHIAETTDYIAEMEAHASEMKAYIAELQMLRGGKLRRTLNRSLDVLFKLFG